MLRAVCGRVRDGRRGVRRTTVLRAPSSRDGRVAPILPLSIDVCRDLSCVPHGVPA